VEARAHETALRRIKDLGAAVGLELGVGGAHGGLLAIAKFCGAAYENECSFSKLVDPPGKSSVAAFESHFTD
jgi:hypothetical protein